MLAGVTSVTGEQPGADAVEVVIEMLELTQEEEGWWPEPNSYWPDPGPLTTATTESTLPALTRLGHEWAGAPASDAGSSPGGSSWSRRPRRRAREPALSGPDAPDRPSPEAAARRARVPAAVQQGAVQAIGDSGGPDDLAWLRGRVEQGP
jgi:hypothetical protein